MSTCLPENTLVLHQRKNIQYRIIRLLAEGGLSHVYLAEQLTTQTHVALKILKQDTRYRWSDELNILSTFKHEYIVDLLDAFEEGSLSCFVFELADFDVESFAKEKQPFTEAEITLACRHIATALDYVHNKYKKYPVLHRDVKPDNILYLKQQQKFKLTDFGVAARGNKLFSIPYQDIPTPWFFPPGITDLKDTSVQTDLYQLGLSMLVMKTGHYPCKLNTSQNDIIQAINAGCVETCARNITWENKTLQSVVLQLVTTDTLKRYSTAKDALEDLKKSNDF